MNDRTPPKYVYGPQGGSADVTAGYVKLVGGVPFSEWDALR